MTEKDSIGFELGLLADQKMLVTQDRQVDLLAIVRSYQKTKPGVFPKHVDRLIDEINLPNSDGSVNKEKRVIWSWGGMSGDGTSFGILSSVKYLIWRCGVRESKLPHITYHNLISDIIIARKLGWVKSPQGSITREEYIKASEVSVELRDLFLNYLPSGRLSQSPLLHIEDNCAETELYYLGETVGSPRGDTRDLRKIIANRWPVFKVSVNAPESVNIQSMDMRETIPALNDHQLSKFLDARGIIDDRSAKEVRRSYIMCGNRETLMQQYRDIVDNSKLLIRKGSSFFESKTLDIGEFDYILDQGSEEWVAQMSNSDLRARWDNFLNEYYQVWQNLLYGSDSPYWGVCLTPDRLPASTYKFENRDWFEEHSALAELINISNLTGESVLSSRLRDLRLKPRKSKVFIP